MLDGLVRKVRDFSQEVVYRFEGKLNDRSDLYFDNPKFRSLVNLLSGAWPTRKEADFEQHILPAISDPQTYALFMKHADRPFAEQLGEDFMFRQGARCYRNSLGNMVQENIKYDENAKPQYMHQFEAGVLPAMRETLETGSLTARYFTVKLAWKAGRAAKKFLPDLYEVADNDSEDKRVRLLAIDAIREIASDTLTKSRRKENFTRYWSANALNEIKDRNADLFWPAYFALESILPNKDIPSQNIRPGNFNPYEGILPIEENRNAA